MRISAHARTPIKGVEFWVGLIIVGGIDVIAHIVQHLPKGATWFWGVGLALCWIGTLVQIYRHGVRAMTWPYVILIAGYTVFMGGRLWIHPPAAISWLANIGLLVVVGVTLAPYVEFSKKRVEPLPLA